MRSVAAAILLFASACGSAQPRPALTIAVITPEPERLPFDPRGARLRAAASEVSRVAGHEIALVVDAALAEDTRGSFEEQLISAFERLARELGAMKEREPDVFAAQIGLFDKVACHYRALAERPEASVDRAARTVHVVEPARGTLLPEGIVTRALADDFEAEAAKRYAKVAPREVPAAERRAYVAFMTSARQLNADKDDEARAARILKMLDVAEEARPWLLSQRSFFVQAYVHREAEVVKAADASAFRRAEKGYGAFLVRELPRMSDDEKLATLRDVFVEGFNGRGYLPFAFPGVDKMALTLPILDAWARAGHPGALREERVNPVLEYVACPHPKNAEGARALVPHCDHHLYRFALAEPARTQRLARAIAGDAVLAETAFVAVRYARAGDAYANVVTLWRLVDADAVAWGAGARVLAEELAATSDRAALVDEVRRQWRAHFDPDRRGALLYVLANADPYDNGAIDWKSFARDFGRPIEARDFGAFLDQGGMALAPVVWPALGDFSRAAVIVPRLDAFLAKRGAVQRLVQRLCDEQRTAELEQLHAYFEERVRRAPGENLTDALDATAPGACPLPKRRR